MSSLRPEQAERAAKVVGGMVPLGYATHDKKLAVVPEEAERIRLIFRRYLELGSVDLLLRDLRHRGVVTKLRSLSNGRTMGGIPFARGSLAYLLRKRFYVAEVVYRGTVCPAEHEPILDRAVFDAVQDALTVRQHGIAAARHGSRALLMGKLVDDRGHCMTPATARKAGRSYGYYVSAALHQGRRDEAGSVPRVAARAIESVMVRALRERCPDSAGLSEGDLVGRHLARARLTGTTVEMDVMLRPHRPADGHPGDDAASDDYDRGPVRVSIPWTRGSTRLAREIIVPKASPRQAMQPIHAATRSTLVRSVAQGRHWLAKITQGTVTGPDAIARREGCSPRRVAMMISLAFLSPDLVQAALNGQLPRGIGVRRLFDAPAEWTRQRAMLGL